MKIGDQVFHPKFGGGTIKLLASKMGHLWARIDFGYAKNSVLVEELMDSPEGSPLKIVPEPESNQDHADEEEKQAAGTIPNSTQVEARKGINALKLGQILESHIFDLSVGTEEINIILKRAMDRALNREVTFLLIEGAWGGGKTHVLTLLQAIAKKKSMAIAYVIMDGHSVSLAKPMELMEEITNSFRFPFDSVLDGLSNILRRAMREGKVSQLRTDGADIIAQVLDALPQGALDHPDVCHLLEDYLSLSLASMQTNIGLSQLGFPSHRLPSIKAGRIWERPEAFKKLLVNWTNFSKIMGARGLLIIFDEIDVEYAYIAGMNKISATMRERRNTLLQELADLAHKNLPLSVAFASAPTGNQEYLDNDAVENLLNVFNKSITHIKVPSPSREQLKCLFDSLFNLYNLAYQETLCNLNEEIKYHIFNGLIERYERRPDAVPRYFVRMSLELLDLLSIAKNRNFQHILELIH